MIMSRVRLHQSDNIMNNLSSVPVNELSSQYILDIGNNTFHNSRRYNFDWDSDNLSINSNDDIKRNNNNNSRERNNNYLKKRNDSFSYLKGNSNLGLHPTSTFPPGFLLTPYCTPPDRYLSKFFLFEVKEVPANLTNGSMWDSLSCSMWKKFLMHRQTEDIYRKKITLWKCLYIRIKTHYPKCGLFLVGSTLTGFGGDSSDVDMCLLVKPSGLDQRRLALYYLRDILLLLKGLQFICKLELIQAKVPILKFRDQLRGLEVDLNCNNSVGIRNTHLLYCYSQLDWRVRPLVIVVKLWAHYHDINDAKNMTISSYSLTLMVIHFLQYGVKPVVLPCLHSEFPNKFSSHSEIFRMDILEELDPYYSLNQMSIGELLVKFFEYYSNFNFSKNAISVRMGSVISVESCRQVRTLKNDPHQWKYLCIEEPFDLTNTARSVYDKSAFDRIIAVFRQTATTLKECATLESIFKPVIFHLP